MVLLLETHKYVNIFEIKEFSYGMVRLEVEYGQFC